MKIAIVATAKASRYLAPFANPEWAPPNGEIWCCGGYDFEVKRFDRWFELHDRSVPLPGTAPGETGWEMNDDVLAQAGKPVFVQQIQHADYEVLFPVEENISMLGDRNLTSTPAHMMALAILTLRPTLCRTVEPEDTIGLWGVEMLLEEEYRDQSPGMQHFLDMCIAMNIEVLLPAGCGLIARPKVYAYEKETAEEKRYRKLAESAQGRVDACKAEAHDVFGRLRFEEGVLETIKILGRGQS